MTFNIKTLANKAVQSLTPYQPGKPVSELEREHGITNAIKLASNENPFGASPLVQKALQEALTNLHTYPDANQHELKSALAKHHQINSNQITLGNGSDNNIELIIKTFLNDHDTAIVSQYTFMTIPLLIAACGAKAITVPTVDYGIDPRAMLEAVQSNTRLLFIVNPNNPTGTYLNSRDFHRLMQALPKNIIVVVDEAYIEFVDVDDFPDTVPALKQYDNLIIVRTFSKAYGLAAVRLGYALSSPDIADLLNRVKLPFNVNSLAACAGLAALKDKAHLQKTIKNAVESKEILMAGLSQLQLEFIPSVANFITVNVGDATKIHEAMLTQGVIIRPLNAYQLPAHIRISLGTRDQMQRCLASLAACL